jgi:hypothetical protein
MAERRRLRGGSPNESPRCARVPARSRSARHVPPTLVDRCGPRSLAAVRSQRTPSAVLGGRRPGDEAASFSGPIPLGQERSGDRTAERASAGPTGPETRANHARRAAELTPDRRCDVACPSGSGGNGTGRRNGAPLRPPQRRRAHESARRNWRESSRSASLRLRTSPESPGAAREPHSLTLRPSNLVPDTALRITPRCGSGGSHLPLRARRNVPADH